MFRTLYRTLIGRPIASEEVQHQELPKWKALPIFSSDALSSVGYGPEQIAIILAASAMYHYFGSIVLAIIVLLAIVATSYSQVVRAHPGGGGSYAVAQEYLGEPPALIAGAALLADYTLTVAVSVSSGTAALTSAFPLLLPYSIHIDMIILFGILMIINLKGVQEASTIFVWPTYAFIVSMLALILAGVYQAASGQVAPAVTAETAAVPAFSSITLFLLLHAFANGCSSMTGVEAIANGVSVFKKPKAANAIKTTIAMAILLGIMLFGLSGLIIYYHLTPREDTTLLSILAETVFGRNVFYYFIQLTTMLILYLAANTSYNGLPPLLSLMAADGYVPRYLRHRGDRLSYDNGIILLSICAGLLIFIFQGNVEHLISLYALGVFLSFTIAQSGLVVHWFRARTPGWQFSALLNGFGACITFAVIAIIAITKFEHGAWLIIVFIPIIVALFKKVHDHYENVAAQLLLTPAAYADLQSTADSQRGKNYVIIPLASPTRAVAKALRYAKTITDDTIHAVHIATDEDYAQRIKQLWQELEPSIELAVIYSPYRQMANPLIRYIRRFKRHLQPNDTITIIIPEFEPARLWHRLLHNQDGWILRLRLLNEDNIVVTTVPLKFKR